MGKTMGETSEYYYLSKEIDRIDPTLFNDIQPYNELLRLNPKRTSINCWIGQRSDNALPLRWLSQHLRAAVWLQNVLLASAERAKFCPAVSIFTSLSSAMPAC